MFLRLISDVPKLLPPRVQLSWLLAQPQSHSSSSHAKSRAGIRECPKEISPDWTQVVGQDRAAGGTIKKLQITPISVWITSDGDKEIESRDLALITCLQQGFVREGTRKQSQQVPLPRVCPAGEFFLSVVLKTQEKTQIISTNHFQQASSGSKRERICLNISVIQGWIVLSA